VDCVVDRTSIGYIANTLCINRCIADREFYFEFRGRGEHTAAKIFEFSFYEIHAALASFSGIVRSRDLFRGSC